MIIAKHEPILLRFVPNKNNIYCVTLKIEKCESMP